MFNPLSNLGQNDVHTQISDIIDEINRQSEQLDSFNSKLSFVATGTLTIAYTGAANFNEQASVSHGLKYAPAHLCFFNLSTEPGKWQASPANRFDSTGQITMEFFDWPDTNAFNVEVDGLAAGTACTVTFIYFLLREPAQQV